MARSGHAVPDPSTVPGPDFSQAADEIYAAFSVVKASVGRLMAGDEEGQDASLEDIFALNNVIGRLVRERPDMTRRLKEIQLCVNLITIGVKKISEADMREGIALTEESFGHMKKEFVQKP